MRKDYKHDASKKKNECRGRGADSKWGVRKIKEKRRKEARVWAYGFWVWASLTHGYWVGSEEV